MDHRVVDALSSHPGIDDWTVRFDRTRSVQIYLAGNDVESIRQGSREKYEVEICNDHPAPAEGEPGLDRARGTATLPLASTDLDRLPTILEDAVGMARLIHNRPWALAGPASMPEVALTDMGLVEQGAATAAGLRTVDQIRDLADRERASGVRLSGAEVFLNYSEHEFANSRGAAASGTATQILTEIVLLAGGDHDETEYFRQTEARRLEDLELSGAITLGARLARDKLRAVAPRSRQGAVVIADGALNQLMAGDAFIQVAAILFHASARAAYEHLSRFEVGRPIYGDREPAGDLLTLRSNACRAYGGGSYRWDEEGLPGLDLAVIDNGVLSARPAGQRYAQYLGIPATGRPGMAEMRAGSTARAELLAGDGPVLEVRDFSATSVDQLSGNFGMEIRVGYEIGTGGPVPVTGGSVTGNLFEALANARFSSETVQFARLAGPAAIRFESLQVAGAD